MVGRLERVVLTPDFHRGGGIPVGTVAQARGFVVPQAVGNDVCCGMRLLVTDITRDELAPHLDAIHRPLRAVFFQGQREIPMSPRQREALLREGLWGLHETRADNAGAGLWRHYDARAQEADLARVHFQGVLPATRHVRVRRLHRELGRDRLARLADRLDRRRQSLRRAPGDRRDPRRHDGARVGRERGRDRDHGALGLGRPRPSGRRVTSSIGRATIYPKELKHPEHGFYVIPTRGPHAALGARYLDAMRNAANFAFGNRLLLGLMTVRVLSEVLGRDVDARLIYDAPHNLIWEDAHGTSPASQGRVPGARGDPR